MTSHQKCPLGFGFSTPENPRIRIFSKCIRKLAPQLKYEFYALTIVTMLSTILCKTVQLATQGHVGILYILHVPQLSATHVLHENLRNFIIFKMYML